MKKRTKKTFIAIHKYLGLLTSLVVFIVAITGCCWSFKEEIENTYNQYQFVEIENKNFIKPSFVKEQAQNYFPNKNIHGVKYSNVNKALEVIFYQSEPELFYQSLFLNPYSGKIIKTVDHTKGFFAFILRGHTHLWLPKAFGENTVSIAVLLFLIIILTGVFIWWPKKIKNLRQRLTFTWNTSTKWKRKNFDLHTVTGFYVSTLGLILAFTGCIMAFGWFYFIAYKTTGGNKDPRFITPKSEIVLQPQNTLKYDDLIPYLYTNYKKAHSFELHYPTNDSLAILVEVAHSKGLHYNMDYLFFDQNNIQEIETNSIYGKYIDAKFADKLIRMNYDIHIGSIGGLTGKIIAFLASLLCATLPITGVFIWFGRRYKRNN